MHLIYRNNNLGAEIDIAAQGTVIRQKGGRILTDQQELINCSRYDNADRNSDPRVKHDLYEGHSKSSADLFKAAQESMVSREPVTRFPFRIRSPYTSSPVILVRSCSMLRERVTT